MLSIDRIKMMLRFCACMAATTSCVAIPPLPLSLALTRRFGREERIRDLHRMVGWATFCRRTILGIDLIVRGQQNLPRPSKGYLFVSNHQSYVDILVLMEALNTVSFLSKSLVLYLPGIGYCAHAGGTIFIKRKDKMSRQRALEDTLRMCHESTAVVVFAEGTRSADGGIRDRIRPGAILAAHDQGLGVIPVGLDGTFQVVPKTMDRVNLNQRVAVSIGRPLQPSEHGDRDSWVDTVWQAVKDEHRRCNAIIGHDPVRSGSATSAGETDHDAAPPRPADAAAGDAAHL